MIGCIRWRSWLRRDARMSRPRLPSWWEEPAAGKRAGANQGEVGQCSGGSDLADGAVD